MVASEVWAAMAASEAQEVMAASEARAVMAASEALGTAAQQATWAPAESGAMGEEEQVEGAAAQWARAASASARKQRDPHCRMA